MEDTSKKKKEKLKIGNRNNKNRLLFESGFQKSLIFGAVFILFFCSKKPSHEEIIELGKKYPDVLCEKIAECAKLEIAEMSPEERKIALNYLPSKENCIEEQTDSKVLPIDPNDPEIRFVTGKRLQDVQSCIIGIQNAKCEDLEESYSIPGCEELYNIGN
jgi:hypothetical protein